MTRSTFHPFTSNPATLDLHSTVDVLDALNFCRDGLEMVADLFVADANDVLNTNGARNGVFRYLTGVVGTLEAISARLSDSSETPRND